MARRAGARVAPPSTASRAVAAAASASDRPGRAATASRSPTTVAASAMPSAIADAVAPRGIIAELVARARPGDDRTGPAIRGCRGGPDPGLPGSRRGRYASGVQRPAIRLFLPVAVALVLAPRAARAQDECDDDTLVRAPLEVTPSVGAQGVTIDAPVVVRYSRGYFGPDGPGGPGGDPPETLIRVGVCPADTRCSVPCDLDAEATPVDGSVQVLGDRLFFLPDGGLADDRVYVGTATGLDRPLDFRFCSSDGVDRSPPSAPLFLDARPDESGTSCELPDGGRRIGLRYEPSSDDGPLGSIEYLLYLTRGPGIAAPELRDRVRNSSSEEALLRLLLTRDEAAEPVCVVVYAVDGVGNVSEATPEECVDPLTTAAFQPLCSARPGTRGAGVVGLAALALAALVLRRRR